MGSPSSSEDGPIGIEEVSNYASCLTYRLLVKSL
jgi:hypothetical protein